MRYWKSGADADRHGGVDPTAGFLHTYNVERPAFNVERPALVFDLMEPRRPNIDRSVLQFLQSHTFHPADFTIRSDGVCRLNPEMARYVVRQMLGGLKPSSTTPIATTGLTD